MDELFHWHREKLTVATISIFKILFHQILS
ncbi:hypothetical protein ACFW04_003669 [Cataglyphis niger]